MIPFIDVGQKAVGIIAIGQDATGVIAVGQVSLGVVAIGQMARGVVAVGQLSIGIVTVGQLSMGAAWCLAQLGIGARGRGGVLSVLPAKLFEKRKDRTILSALMGRRVSEGWVDLWLVVPVEGPPRLLDKGVEAPVEVVPALADRIRGELSEGVYPVCVHVTSDERLEPSAEGGYREAPTAEVVLSAANYELRPNPSWSAVLWSLRLLGLAAMLAAFCVTVAIPFVEAVR